MFACNVTLKSLGNVISYSSVSVKYVDWCANSPTLLVALPKYEKPVNDSPATFNPVSTFVMLNLTFTGLEIFSVPMSSKASPELTERVVIKNARLT